MPDLLRIEGLKTYFEGPGGPVRVLDGLDLAVAQGQILGLVGESGSGKSVTALSVMRLIRPPGRIVGGRILFDGTDLLQLSEVGMRAFRGRRMGMIFQDPRGYLNPVMRVGMVMAEVFRTHAGVGRREAKERSLEMLRRVGLPAPERVLRAYPHELSGGMAQRVMIALALAGEPRLLIADEPTTALDVTVQAQIIRLLADLRRDLDLTVILITHNLSVVAEVCDEVAVMYAGQVVELAPAYQVFERSRHPYTVSLLRARPSAVRSRDLAAIPGHIPNLRRPPLGCRFQPRCFMAGPRCAAEVPALRHLEADHLSRCHYAEEVGERSGVA